MCKMLCALKRLLGLQHSHYLLGQVVLIFSFGYRGEAPSTPLHPTKEDPKSTVVVDESQLLDNAVFAKGSMR